MACLLVERQSCMDQLDLSAWSYVGFRQTIAELRVQRDAIDPMRTSVVVGGAYALSQGQMSTASHHYPRGGGKTAIQPLPLSLQSSTGWECGYGLLQASFAKSKAMHSSGSVFRSFKMGNTMQLPSRTPELG